MATLPGAMSHSWIENIFRISATGAFEGPAGYARGTVDRGNNPGPDIYMVNRILANDSSIPMCGPNQQIGSQKPEFPVMQASQGDMIALRYAENGHVTKLEAGRPEYGGTIFIYGTSKPSKSDTYLGIHGKWNAEGTGGDGRGALIATRPYDDGQCWQYLPESGLSQARRKEFPKSEKAEKEADLLCQSDIKIPDDAGPDYTLYWVWEWPLLKQDGTPASVETYTQCIDLKVSPKSGTSAKSQKIKFQKGKAADLVAIPAQLNNAFLLDPSAPLKMGPIPVGANSPQAGAASSVSLPPLPSDVRQPFAPDAQPTASSAQQDPSRAPDAQPSSTQASPQSPSSARAPNTTPTGGQGSNPGAGGNGFITVTVTQTPPTVTVTETQAPAATTQAPVQVPDGDSEIVLPTKSKTPALVTKTNTLVPPSVTVTVTPTAQASAQKPTSVATGSPAPSSAPDAGKILPIPPKKAPASSASPAASESSAAPSKPAQPTPTPSPAPAPALAPVPAGQNSTLQARYLHSRNFKLRR